MGQGGLFSAPVLVVFFSFRCFWRMGDRNTGVGWFWAYGVPAVETTALWFQWLQTWSTGGWSHLTVLLFVSEDVSHTKPSVCAGTRCGIIFTQPTIVIECSCEPHSKASRQASPCKRSGGYAPLSFRQCEACRWSGEPTRAQDNEVTAQIPWRSLQFAARILESSCSMTRTHECTY